MNFEHENIHEMHHYHYIHKNGLDNTFVKSPENPNITFLKIKNMILQHSWIHALSIN